MTNNMNLYAHHEVRQARSRQPTGSLFTRLLPKIITERYPDPNPRISLIVSMLTTSKLTDHKHLQHALASDILATSAARLN
jgi:hypothetical protein